MTLQRFQSVSAPAGDRAPKLHVVTFGCQMNKYDSLLVEGRFRQRGYQTVATPDDADVLLFNTCSVREHAEERVHSWVGELKLKKRERPDLVIGVMGCMAQRMGEEIGARAGHVDLVVGTRAFRELPELVDLVRERRQDSHLRRARDRRVVALDMQSSPDGDRRGEPYTGGLSGFLAVMRGCDLNCTFCVVPTVRGRVLSRGIDELVREARWMIDQGARAITLLGQTVNSWGEDLPAPAAGAPRYRGRQGRPGLADLLYALQPLAGLERLRLITLHPAYVTQELACAIAECDKVERFLPLPLQSGSDRILKAMKRGYTVDGYRRRVELLRSHVPDLELGSDWIVGFPGESDADFQESEAALAEQGFAHNYIFKYSPRPGTEAATRFADDVPESVKRERNQRLLAASERTALSRHQAWIGRQVTAFLEERDERGQWIGRTRHGLPIRVRSGAELRGSTHELRVVHATSFGLGGELVVPTLSAPTG